MGREHHCTFLGQFLDQLSYLEDLQGIESIGGLVEDQHIRTVQDGLTEPYSLTIPLGERGNRPREPIEESNGTGRLDDRGNAF